MHGTMIPYEVYAQFYDRMRELSNEDGYCICSPSRISEEMGRAPSTTRPMLDTLIKAGCVTEHKSKQVTASGKPTASIYQLTGIHLTREVYNFFILHSSQSNRRP